MALSIHTAAQNNQLSLVQALVDENPNIIDTVDVDGRTPLHWAASVGATEIASYLIDRGADIDKVDGSGWAALHIAVSAGREEVVQELIGAGANVNQRNDKGITPLHYAASKSRIELESNKRTSFIFQIGKYLIQRGADINARDKSNQLPLHRAATTGSTGFISLLLHPPEGVTTKVRLNTGDRVGNTPLHLAMESAHAEAAVLLIEAGADRGRANVEDTTPEDVDGVGGQEQRRVKAYVIDRCGRP